MPKVGKVTVKSLFGHFNDLGKGELSSQNDDNRRQLRTIVDKYLKPPFAKPHLDFSKILFAEPLKSSEKERKTNKKTKANQKTTKRQGT